MLPSVTIMDGIIGGILSLPGVSDCAGYENDTNVTDANGIPGHGISLVVDGGDAQQIATLIANKKTMGSPTYGTTTETVIDRAGNSRTINFFRPSNANIYVKITLTALRGYTNEIGASLAQSVSDYISNLNIGDIIYTTRLYKYATLSADVGGLTYDLTKIEIGMSPDSLSDDNITLPFNAKPVCTTSNITVSAS